MLIFAIYICDVIYRLDFTITADHGNRDHWKYSVLYKERLSHWPYWINVATADFDVRITNEKGYLVESHHRTCFFHGFYCCMYTLWCSSYAIYRSKLIFFTTIYSKLKGNICIFGKRQRYILQRIDLLSMPSAIGKFLSNRSCISTTSYYEKFNTTIWQKNLNLKILTVNNEILIKMI